MSTILDSTRSLPAFTQEGLDTFGCLVNGKIFVPNPVPGQRSALYGELQYYNQLTGLNIYVDDHVSNRAIIIFFYHPLALTPGKKYDVSSSEFFVQYIDFNKAPVASYRSEVKGTITVDKCSLGNSSPRMIAGTFEFTMRNAEDADVITITEGRFDVGDIRE